VLTLFRFILSLCLCAFLGCAVHIDPPRQFTLTTPPIKPSVSKPRPYQLYISSIDTDDGLDSTNIYYALKPLSRNAYSKNAWQAPFPQIFQPIIVNSLIKANLFEGVNDNSVRTNPDFQLSTRLISFYQDFTHSPSVLHIQMKCTLIDLNKQRIRSTFLIEKRTSCPSDNAYGAVLATQQTLPAIMKDIISFVNRSVN
jgi:ABC-type uncharacterized transport system auxiliary subunit